MKRWIATVAMMLGLLGLYMAPAHADPTNAPSVFPFMITCDGTTYTAVAVPGQGQWTPALVTTNNVVLIPFSFEFVVTNLTTGETETFTFSKPAADQAANVTCTFTLTETDPVTGETLRIVGTAEGLRAPPVG